MQVILVLLAAVVVVVVLITVFGAIGPVIAGAGVLLAAVVALNPGAVGSRIRQSPGWWGIPGFRAASAGAAPFVALLLLYTVPLPVGAFVLAHAGIGGGPPVAAAPSLNGVGGGGAGSSGGRPPSALPTSLFTPPPITGPVDTPSATPDPTPPPTAAPTAVPTAAPPTAHPTVPPTPPPASTCGAPPNPWNYNFCGHSAPVTSPPSNFCDYFTCIKSFWKATTGYVDECNDGTYSHSGGRQGACSSHRGELRPLDQ